MFLYYFKIAYRSLTRNKLFTFVNVFGLALSMSICLLVLLRLQHQLSMDNFHTKSDNIYRVTTEVTSAEGALYRYATSPVPLGIKFIETYPFIANETRILPASYGHISNAEKRLGSKVCYTDASFFTIFSFQLIEGDIQTALSKPGTIVLSERFAEKMFGTTNIIGKVLRLNDQTPVAVSGVLRSPGKSHIDFDGFLPFVSYTENNSSPGMQWNDFSRCYTYLLLKPTATSNQLKTALEQTAAALKATSPIAAGEDFRFDFQGLDNIILGEELRNSLGDIGSRGKTGAEIGIGLIILLCACFNYTNLSIARSLKRGKEVGIRKVNGAMRNQVFYQFIVESVLICLMALCFAGLLLRLMIDYAPFSSEMVPIDYHFNYSLIAWFIAFALFTGLLAGVLPAWALSAFNPVEVLKNLANIKLFGGNRFRKGLIITQFAVSLLAIIFTTVAIQQFNYLTEKDPGYDRSNLISISLNGADAAVSKNTLLSVPGVESITAVSGTLGRDVSGTVVLKTSDGKYKTSAGYYDVDTSFLTTMKLPLIAGKLPGENHDTEQGGSVLVNEQALKWLNIAVADAPGQQLTLGDSTQVRICGVVKDFNFQSLALPVTPLVLRSRAEQFNVLQVRTALYSKSTISSLEAAWKGINPQVPFEAYWMQDELRKRGSATGTVSMLALLAFISVTIGCLGMLGMVIYTTETRTKEIGVRKVLGASVTVIVQLLSREFVRLVAISGLIAIPLSVIACLFFLQIFANRVSLDPLTILLSFAGLLVLVLITISTQIIKAATANPVESLKV